MGTDGFRALAIVFALPLVILGISACSQSTSATKDMGDPTSTPAYTETPVSPTATIAITEVAARALRATGGTRPSATPLLTAVATATTSQDLIQEPEKPPKDILVTPTSTPRALDGSPVSNTSSISETIIGYSRESRPIAAYQFGAGSDVTVLIGGIHGGYEWNSILLAYEAIDYFSANPEEIPESAALYVVPSANPDGQYAITGKEGRFTPEDVAAQTVSGRFNGRGVDLNRNWDCQWTETAYWGAQAVNPGAAPFSEPETAALRDFLIALHPGAVIFYHSAADGVYSAGCHENYLPSWRLADLYSSAAYYPLFDQFNHYNVTGDAGNWLAIHGIPAITVELASHDDIEWRQNRAGILKVLASDSFISSEAELPAQ